MSSGLSDIAASAGSERIEGTVTDFDDDRGLGIVTANDGTEHPFHCTAIADGTRSIDRDARVTYRTRPAPMGRWEATDIRRA